MSPLKGWDIITPDPGKHQEILCPTCGEAMDVQRNVHGPTGFAEAMSKGGHLHDRFRCRHSEEKWHIQARNLKREAEGTNSKTIEDLLLKEVEQILETKQPTKDPRGI